MRSQQGEPRKCTEGAENATYREGADDERRPSAAESREVQRKRMPLQGVSSAVNTVLTHYPNSNRNFLIAFLAGQTAPCARRQILVPGMIPIPLGTLSRLVIDVKDFHEFSDLAASGYFPGLGICSNSPALTASNEPSPLTIQRMPRESGSRS